MTSIAVLIATSHDRQDLLFNRALKSVFAQTQKPDMIVVCDDNENSAVSEMICDKLYKVGRDDVFYIKNTRTHGMSGTGAWNTGIEYIKNNLGEDAYVAILDDDDEWIEDHIANCSQVIENAHPQGVFPYIYRTDWEKPLVRRTGINTPLVFTQKDLTIKNFLIGDPGIQGSNMVIRVGAFESVGCFDEHLSSCTDRDMMISLLKCFPRTAFIVLPIITVIHYVGHDSVTSNKISKHRGLDYFYEKHLFEFPNSDVLERSLHRAERLFGYNGDKVREKYHLQGVFAISMAIHNGADTVCRALNSILSQIGCKRHIKVVIGDDGSTDDWQDRAGSLLEDLDVEILLFNYHQVSKTRNAINDFILLHVDKTEIIGRLDVDDMYASSDVLQRIEKLFDEQKADVVIGGNGYMQDGRIVEKCNMDNSSLQNVSYLLNRVKGMSEGRFECELPSCNLFVVPAVVKPYPSILSAEDHFLTIYYLAFQLFFKVVVTDDIIVTYYNLGGLVTCQNQQDNSYMEARRSLFTTLEDYIGNVERIEAAANILRKNNVVDFHLLGLGREGVSFRAGEYVYKVFDKGNNNVNSFFLEETLSDSKHFYQVGVVNDNIICYKYELSAGMVSYSLDDAVSFLAECWKRRIIIKDCKPSNFIRTRQGIKLIDMNGHEYDDNLFLNMCARMFLYASYAEKKSESEMRILTRSAINNFELPELDGLCEFVNKVFATIIFEESGLVVNSYCLDSCGECYEDYTFENLPNLETLFFSKLKDGQHLKGVSITDVSLSQENYFKPRIVRILYNSVRELPEKVSLLIKCCPQDVETLEQNVRHIVRQLSCPNTFMEVLLGIDPHEGFFLRQYNTKGSLDKLIKVADKLVRDNVVDRYVVHNEDNNIEINKRWFGLSSKYSHTDDLKPVTPQLYALEACRGDYILQMDSDVIIGRRDMSHSFLRDMLDQLEGNDKVVSVGFNICNKDSKPYYGFENGGFVPEVRFGLFDKKRLFSLRQFPNNLDKNGKLTTSWFRALEDLQHQTGYCSIRGGDMRSFYVHPQNYRKQNPYSWMYILDRVEQLEIPDCQYGHFDCEGSLNDWCGHKRDEDIVVVSVFRNVRYDRFLRMWASLISQTNQDFGILLYDDCSDNGLPIFIDSLIRNYRNRVTFVKGRHHVTRMENVYHCIHDFMSNQQSIVVMLDGDDAFIGNGFVEELSRMYRRDGIDVLVGRCHQTYRIQPYYRYPVDFVRPRQKGGNVFQHTKSFKKYLFDSVPKYYFKYANDGTIGSGRWLERTDDYAMMVPIIEMSQNPCQYDYINYYYERDYIHKDGDRALKERCIAEILNKPALKHGAYIIGRKSFFPDYTKIEIDITYDCNLKCKGCNRSCGLAPSRQRMSLDDIDRFIKESISLGIKWNLINILGGEPTLHPDFEKIIETLHNNYIEVYSENTILQVVSNGYHENSRMLCDKIRNYKNVRIDYGSYKQSNRIDYFTSFNDAPCDHAEHFCNDYSKGCWVAHHCGLNLNYQGYYACSVCGAIDRVVGYNQAASTLSELNQQKIISHFQQFCPLCGNFIAYKSSNGEFIPRSDKEPFQDIVSVSWKKIYADYNNKRIEGENNEW